MPRLTVLLPNYNNAPYLKACLDSLFTQTFSDFIILFVDDCSTDQSLKIAKEYNDFRLKIIEKKEQSGIVDTMNEGLAVIETEYFIRMDGDDLSVPNRFERLVQFMDDNSEIDVCSSAISYFGMEEGTMIYETDPEKNKANLIFGHTIGHASSIFRTKVFKENNIQYLDRFWRMEDYDLFYRLKDLTKTTSISDPLYLYRREGYNNNIEITKKKNEEFRKFYAMILKELGINPTVERVEMHLELTKRKFPSFKFEDYYGYIKELKQINKENNVFPIRELGETLDKHFVELMYLLVDNKKMSWGQILKNGKKYKGLLAYAIKTRIFKRGKNKLSTKA